MSTALQLTRRPVVLNLVRNKVLFSEYVAFPPLYDLQKTVILLFFFGFFLDVT
jgi:hypothetical protein